MAAGATKSRSIMRELAYREGDGMSVTLLWREADDALVVVVFDERAGTVLQVPAERHNALQVFRHPHAFA
jgi:hypothetical protein